jgi:hypothetical protein
METKKTIDGVTYSILLFRSADAIGQEFRNGKTGLYKGELLKMPDNVSKLLTATELIDFNKNGYRFIAVYVG